ncbi:MAG TPA: Hsp20/alpha crystallin family protein [Xanthobacteraceae bacterium]|jgi:HSP20 family molecular chaperone IbpA|nr:Hsp20/alpha crystallin family protein [Xanthobacteraceae bacterium]
MASEQELPVQQKREVEKKQESTIPARVYVPVTDIFETQSALMLAMEMPGVDRENVDIKLEGGILTVEGEINFAKYEDLYPVYTEYNIGNYARSFELSSDIDQDRISAELKDGVVMLTLPKAAKATPRKIKVN